MLRRIAARGRALRHVSRAAQNRSKSPFTTLTKPGATTHSARGEAPRAMMGSHSAGPSRVSGTETYLDYTSSPDIDFAHIKSNMTCTKFHDSIWGFVIYRCSQGNQTVPAPFHDGATEYEEEDVGWMYMPLQDYLHKYDLLGKGDWDDQYVRPPYIDGTEDKSEFVGHWRQESLSEGA